MGRRQAMLVVVAGCLAIGGDGALAVDVDGPPPARPPGASDTPDASGARGDDERHYVEIPFGRHAPADGAAAPPRPPAAKPPSTPQIDAAIGELGDPDFRKREAAAERLRVMGRTAVPALEHARDTATDPEVAARADATLRNIERPPATRGPSPSAYAYRGVPRGRFELHDFQPLNGNLNLQLRQEQGGRRRVEVREAGGRVIRIDEGPAGIRVSVTTQENGKPVTREFAAATAEALKAKDKDAFELYNRWTGRAGGVLRPPLRAHPRFEPMPVIPPVNPRDEGDQIHERMREWRRWRREEMRDQRRRQEAERAAGAAVDAGGSGAAQEVLGLLDDIRERRGAAAEDRVVAGDLPGEEELGALLRDVQPQAARLLAEIKDLERRAAAGIRTADETIDAERRLDVREGAQR